ncbi:MaoC family dehydratase [Alteromonas gilva]|uniref:MaoC family dehydratase n=1 Tax=Alteromonas gilva TaxID=2987522 RepID=A0ABT5KZS7_9ALTE|nr:MaoC family dehydratase [Alteromonas gilva]MDC8830128.1 MaoC family dehydratase [Alteromonas gilva]
MIIIESMDLLSEYRGKLLGSSRWHTVEQRLVTAFAEVTDDHQGIHLNATDARAAGFDKPIAHGYLLLSLLPGMAQQVYRVKGVSSKINYGLEHCRFINPVMVGAKVQAQFALHDIRPKPQGILLTVDATLNINQQSKPALVARTLALLIP